MVVIAMAPLIPSANASDADLDFKFLELRRQWREDPNGPQSRHYLFAMGEYYFGAGMPSEAVEYFRAIDPEPSRSTEELLATVYLLRCAQASRDVKAAGELKIQLQEALSSKGFFEVFHTERGEVWQSLLGNRYDFTEEVDRLEIRLNDKPFYTINIS